jgi:putative transposase
MLSCTGFRGHHPLTAIAASSLERPSAIATQNRRRASRRATERRPGDRNTPRPARSEQRPLLIDIATPSSAVLRRPIESTQYTSESFQRLLRDLGVTCSMSRSGNVWDNSVMERFFSTLKTERTHRHHYATRNAARADVFNYIETLLQSHAEALHARQRQPRRL